MRKSTLKLTLKKKWFDLILKGEKKEEYREIKDYWINRLTIPMPFSEDGYEFICDEFSLVEFSNGYGDKVGKILIECKSIEIKEGKTEWGVEKETEYFVITLGEIVCTSNIYR